MNALAVRVVYQGVPPDGAPPRLDAKYTDAAKVAAVEQVKRGGVRLAWVLNQAMK